MIVELSHVAILMPVGAEDRARDFYGRLLGLSEMSRPYGIKDEGGLWYRLGMQQLHLCAEASTFQLSRSVAPGILVRDIGIFAKKLREARCEVTWHDDWPAYQRLSTLDPFGNRLEFIEPR